MLYLVAVVPASGEVCFFEFFLLALKSTKLSSVRRCFTISWSDVRPLSSTRLTTNYSALHSISPCYKAQADGLTSNFAISGTCERESTAALDPIIQRRFPCVEKIIQERLQFRLSILYGSTEVADQLGGSWDG